MQLNLHALPNKRPQLLAVLISIGAELLLQFANNRNGILESILPRLKSSSIWSFHSHSAWCVSGGLVYGATLAWTASAIDDTLGFAVNGETSGRA